MKGKELKLVHWAKHVPSKLLRYVWSKQMYFGTSCISHSMLVACLATLWLPEKMSVVLNISHFYGTSMTYLLTMSRHIIALCYGLNISTQHYHQQQSTKRNILTHLSYEWCIGKWWANFCALVEFSIPLYFCKQNQAYNTFIVGMHSAESTLSLL